MNSSKRNPLLRNNMAECNNVIGSLGEEIQEQNLSDIQGGSSHICATIEVSAVVATAVGGAVTWVNDKATAKYKCGGVLTATAECFGC